ncbi:hypothetical protein GE061_009995, partial [Apolygus lucorum]
YQGFNNQIGGLSPQEQILQDVQQHRFFGGPQRQRQPPQNPPFQPSSSGFQGFHSSENRFPYHNFQTNYQPERPKPVLLQPTYSDDYKPLRQPEIQQNFQPPLSFTPQNSFTPSFPPPSEQTNYQQAQPSFNQPQQQPPSPTFHQGFQAFDNNYVAPEKQKKHQQYLTETVIPKQPPTATYRPDLKEETPSWVLETQPANSPYKKQKPLEAITFATEVYKPSTQAPRVVKYRPRPKQEEKDVQLKDQSDEIFIKTDRKKLYEQLIQSDKKSTVSVTPRITTPKPVRSTTTAYTTTTQASRQPDEQYIQEQLQKQIQEQLGGKNDIFQTLKISLPGDLSPEQIANLPNIALGDSVAQLPEYPGGFAGFPGLPSGKDGAIPETVFLANGQKLKIASAPSKSQKNKNVKTVIIQQTTTTTPAPPKVSFEELTKGVLPPGAEYELIRQGQDGGLEKVQNIPQKKVTFVILEEQPDGSVKVQGVRGSENEPTETKGSEVDSIIAKLKNGEIKLPPSTKLSKPNKQTYQSVTPSESQASHNYVKHDGKVSEKVTTSPKRKPTTSSPVFVHSTPSISLNSHSGPVFQEDFAKITTESTPRVPQYTSPQYTSPQYTSPQYTSPKYNSPTPTPPKFLPTLAPHNDESINYIPSSTYNPVYSTTTGQISTTTNPPPTSTPSPATYSFTPQSQSTSYPNEDYYSFQTPSPNSHIGSSSPVAILGDTLKANGLYAMARYLRQSGLDMVLNETGDPTGNEREAERGVRREP